MIDTRRLRYFMVVAEELHFGRAAERLSMAQSPLSQQIRQLERELGVELLHRGHHVVGLTDAGRALARAAGDLLADLDRAVEVTKRASRGEVGNLGVGYVSEVTADILPVSLNAYKSQYPDVAIDLREGTTGFLLEALRSHSVDVAFVRVPGSLEGVEYEQLIEEALFAALPRGHRLAGENLALADLAAEPFVVPTAQAAHGLRRDIDRACAEAGFSPSVARQSSPMTSVLLLVAAGAGVALIPASVAHSYPVPRIHYLELKGPPTTTAGMSWRRHEPSVIVQNFLQTTRDVVDNDDHEPDVWPERHVEHDPAP